MKTLQLGPKLALPLDAVTQTFGVLAVRGAGKSNLAAVLAEEMHAAGLPFVAIDPVGSWWGLRSNSDGKGPGLAIPIFGGEHGDVPLDRGSGEMLADLIAEKRLSCVVDLTSFDSEAAKKSFLLAFATRLYRKNKDPLHLFLEEADDYIPQRPMRDETHLLRAWENIVRRGRARGIGLTLISQRSAALNKNVLTQIETLFALRTTGPQDRNAIEEWVKYHAQSRDLLESLSGLADGEAWCWSPHWLQRMERVHIRRRWTFDSGATPRQAQGARRIATLADVDLPSLTAEWSATIDRAKADDPKALHRRIAELEKQLASKTTATVEVPVLQVEEAELLAGLRNALDRASISLGAVAGRRWKEHPRAEFIAGAREGMIPNRAEPRRPTPALDGERKETLREKSARLRTGSSIATSSRRTLPNLGAGERAILIAIAQHREGVTREQLSVLTGYKRSSRDTYLQRLRAADFVRVADAGDRLIATDAGADVLGSGYEPLPTGDALRSHWLGRLPEGERRVLDVLVGAYPGAVERSAIDDLTGYKRSSRDTYLQRLSSRKLIEFVGRGEVRASEALFS